MGFGYVGFVRVCGGVGFVLDVLLGGVVGDGGVCEVCSRLLEMADIRGRIWRCVLPSIVRLSVRPSPFCALHPAHSSDVPLSHEVAGYPTPFFALWTPTFALQTMIWALPSASGGLLAGNAPEMGYNRGQCCGELTLSHGNETSVEAASSLPSLPTRELPRQPR